MASFWTDRGRETSQVVGWREYTERREGNRVAAMPLMCCSFFWGGGDFLVMVEVPVDVAGRVESKGGGMISSLQVPTF